MIQQQVNLYPAQNETGGGLTTSVALISLGVFFLVVFIAASVQMFHKVRRQDRLEQQQQRVFALRDQVESLSETIALQAPNPLYAEQREALRTLDRKQQKILTEVASLTQKGQAGFASSLKALGEVQVPGLWLEQIEFLPGKEHINLAGKAVSADRVASYLQALKKARVFAGVRFEMVTVEQAVDNPSLLVFRLVSQRED